MAVLETLPIHDADLDEACTFLHEHLNSRIAASGWKQSLCHPWSDTRPNYGFQLKDGSRVVGVICATYSDQYVNGRLERFCNPNSWCVLPQYRTNGLSLVLAVIRQKGYHFTMLTPNPRVCEIFQKLRFKTLSDTVVTFPNLPWRLWRRGNEWIEHDAARISERLTDSTRRDFELHRDLPWLEFAAFGSDGDSCLVAFKRERMKRLPSARVVYVSNPTAFHQHLSLLQRHMLFNRGLVLTTVELRFIGSAPALARRSVRYQPKLYLSSTIGDSDVQDFYSEVVALDQ